VQARWAYAVGRIVGGTWHENAGRLGLEALQRRRAPACEQEVNQHAEKTQ
jgi:hypothetical protein